MAGRNGLRERCIEGHPAAFGQGANERIAFLRRGGGEERDLHVHAAGALEIHLHQIRPAGGERPENAAALPGVAHLLGHHAIDAAGDAGVAGVRSAAAERLIRFIDEDDAAAERIKQAEDFFEIALGAADPAVAKVLHLHHRHPASPARHSTMKVLPVPTGPQKR